MAPFMKHIDIISRCSQMHRNEVLEETGLKGVHYNYILLLCRCPGIPQEEIARKIYINKSNVTRHLNKLEENGYVERRQSDEDKRAILVYPTEKAYDIQPFVKQVVRSWNDYLTEGFTEDELVLFSSVLKEVAMKAAQAVNKNFESE